MTTKRAIIATVAILLIALVLGFGALFMFVKPSSRNANAQAAQIGQGVAGVCLVPLGIVWILWAARVRKEREEKQKKGSHSSRE